MGCLWHPKKIYFSPSCPPFFPCFLFFEHTSVVPSPFFLFRMFPLALKKNKLFSHTFSFLHFFFSHTFSCLPFFLTHLQLSPKHSPFFLVCGLAFSIKKKCK